MLPILISSACDARKTLPAARPLVALLNSRVSPSGLGVFSDQMRGLLTRTLLGVIGAPTRIAGVATCPSLLSSLSMHTYTTYNRPGCSRQPEKRYVKFPAPGSSGCASFVSELGMATGCMEHRDAPLSRRSGNGSSSARFPLSRQLRTCEHATDR